MVAAVCCCRKIQKGRFLDENRPLTCVELRGFEPLTPSMRTRCATGLRYSPKNVSQPSKRPAFFVHELVGYRRGSGDRRAGRAASAEISAAARNATALAATPG
jgi:hypothetical protein